MITESMRPFWDGFLDFSITVLSASAAECASVELFDWINFGSDLIPFISKKWK